MRKVKCPACRRIQMRYNRAENNFICTCGHACDHHPDLCPEYHRDLGCLYSVKSEGQHGKH